jgi:hypothetical protein
MRNLRDVYQRPYKQAALSIGALLGNLGGGAGIRLLGRLREKENAYLGPSFLEPEYIKRSVWRPSANLVSNRAPLGSYQSMGYKGPVYKAYVHRDHKGSHPNSNQSNMKYYVRINLF